ncbi:hypothetical protein [Kitasatospora sp. LaBMicrA B282]|uniref:hypothetical protein n=1 Tax=Kitasatospora sp. LaBMicrA B282 TaxID=3420949 RepID=UPI003D0F26D4
MSTATTTHVHLPRHPWPITATALWLLRLLTAAGLAIDAYVHADLAPTYDPIKATVSQGDLFRAEAAAAALAALLLLALPRRRSSRAFAFAWAFAFLVAAAGVAAVLVYRYFDVGALGPLPNMHEPFWYPEKTLSAVAEGAAAATALAGLAVAWHQRRRITHD